MSSTGTEQQRLPCHMLVADMTDLVLFGAEDALFNIRRDGVRRLMPRRQPEQKIPALDPSNNDTLHPDDEIL